MSFSVLAILCARNEADILPWTLRRLLEQGASVYMIDNWSTDDTIQVALDAGVKMVEVFPLERPSTFNWGDILRRKEEIAEQSSADWILHCDADEIRYSPRAGEALLDAIRRVDAAGYNAIDHTVLNFLPSRETYEGQNPEEYFNAVGEPAAGDGRQIKAWKNVGRVDLASSGGHDVRFPGRTVCPIRFVMKHYPFRSFQQRREKVRDRFARWHPGERAMGWHVQYDRLVNKVV